MRNGFGLNVFKGKRKNVATRTYIEMKRTHEVGKSIFYESSIKKDLRQIGAFFHGILDQKLCSRLNEVVVLFCVLSFSSRKYEINPQATITEGKKPLKKPPKSHSKLIPITKINVMRQTSTFIRVYEDRYMYEVTSQPKFKYHKRQSTFFFIGFHFVENVDFSRIRWWAKKSTNHGKKESAEVTRQPNTHIYITVNQTHFKRTQHNPNACQNPNEIEDSLHFGFVMW